MRRYFLNTYDLTGHLVGRLEFAAPNDLDAEGAVGELHNARDHELWCGKRWVCSWPARGGQPPPGAA